jgi:hypothetical protein
MSSLPPPAVATPNFDETWKAVIDFAKTVMSIASALLAAIASLVLVGTLKLEGAAIVPPVLLILCIVCCLFGFGRSIDALRKGLDRKPALAFCNVAVFLLITAIVLAPYKMAQAPARPLDEALAKIESATKSWATPLTPALVSGVERNGDEHIITYRLPAGRMEVAFTPAKNELRYARMLADCPVPVCPACPSCSPQEARKKPARQKSAAAVPKR